ncbi:MAG: BF3164 family lipoprotein [Mangrovibacterium sp.]
MKIKEILTFLIFIICIQSCKNSDEEIVFPINKDVKSEIIVKDMVIKLPSHIFVIDSLLIFQDVFAEEKYIKYYNLKNRKLLTEFGYKGKGPGELVTPHLMYIDMNSYEICIYDPNLQKMHISDVYKFSDTPDKIFDLKSNDKKDANKPYYTTQPNGSIFYVTGLFKNGYLASVDTEKKRYEYFGRFPFKPRGTNNLNISDANNGSILLTPDKNNLVITTHRFGYLACYGVNRKNLPELKWEIHLSEPKYRLDGQRIVFSPTNKIGTMDMVLTDDKIYLLYQGKDFRYYTSLSSEHNPRTVMVFTIGGKPLAKYHLDKSAVRIAVDRDENIYCITTDPGYNLVKLKLD